MDSELEQALLRLIDRFLESSSTSAAFNEFWTGFSEFYFERTQSPLAKDLPPSIEDWIHGELGERISQEYEALLPRERAEFFEFVLERARMTLDDPTSQERHYGYGSIAEFVEVVRPARAVYRSRFKDEVR